MTRSELYPITGLCDGQYNCTYACDTVNGQDQCVCANSQMIDPTDNITCIGAFMREVSNPAAGRGGTYLT